MWRRERTRKEAWKLFLSYICAIVIASAKDGESVTMCSRNKEEAEVKILSTVFRVFCQHKTATISHFF